MTTVAFLPLSKTKTTKKKTKNQSGHDNMLFIPELFHHRKYGILGYGKQGENEQSDAQNRTETLAPVFSEVR